MDEADFNNLAGQIEGVALVLTHLISDLEMREVMDGRRFTKGVRRFSNRRNHQMPWLPVAKRSVKRLLDDIDEARKARQTLVRHSGSPTR
jgi:hypothetical protein